MDTAPATAGRLEIVSDAICPWCWIGKAHLDGALALLREDGLDLRHRLAALPAEPRHAGGRRRPPRLPDAEVRLLGTVASNSTQQVAEAGRVAGVAFRHDLMARTPNTIEAHRLIRLAGEAGVQHDVMERVFRAYFHEGRDIGDPAVLAQAGAEGGMPEEALAAFTAGEAARAEVVGRIACPGAGRHLRRAVLPAGPAPAVLGRDAGGAHGGCLPPRARYPAQPRRLTAAKRPAARASGAAGPERESRPRPRRSRGSP